MSFREWIGSDREAVRWRRLRAEYDRLESLGHPGPGELVARGGSWRAIPRDRRDSRERASMRGLPAATRALVDIVVDGFASHSDALAYVEMGTYPVVGFVDLVGSTFSSANGTGYLTLRLDHSLLRAPDGFARILAIHAAAAAPHYLFGAHGDGVSTWPSRSAMTRLRRMWATTGDYPAPDGWTYVGKTLLRNAYWRAGLDHKALLLGAEPLTEEMARWADAQPHPYDSRYYPSWWSRHLVQHHDTEIFSS